MAQNWDMLVLGVETSCDETAVGVGADGRRLLANVVASQAAVHARYGGVVPEVASRHHIEAMLPVVRAALTEAGCKPRDPDAIAVTAGPPLAPGPAPGPRGPGPNPPRLPRAWLGNSSDFSFSGLKTAVANLVKEG